MSKHHDREREELLEDLEDLRGGRRGGPDGTPAIGIILVILILMGAGWFGTKDDDTEVEVDPANFVAAECKVSGCNNELCVGAEESISSTCEYKDEYACYVVANTTCEVQSDGECGWTETENLSQCLAGA